MKKIYICLTLLLSFLFTSCDLGFFGSEILGGINSDSSVNESVNSSSEPIDEAIIPLYSQETIKSNVASYSHSFKITISDRIYSYELKFDHETSTGLAKRQDFTVDNEKVNDPTDYFFIKDKNNDCIIYSDRSDLNSYSFYKDKEFELFYLRFLFDISSEVVENAPYESKTELTYAGRQATKYVISNPEYILASNTKLYIILDNETGAFLSVTYDYINFYESSEFTPNNKSAKDEVVEMKNTIPFEYFDTRILQIVNLENIVFPEEKFLVNASIEYKDSSSKDFSNMFSYSVGYHYFTKDTTFITDLCRYIYDQGIKYDDEGKLLEFDKVYKDELVDLGYVNMHIISSFGNINVNGVKYYVKLQAQSTFNEPNFWYVFINIYAR